MADRPAIQAGRARRGGADAVRWLQGSPSLDELAAAFPAEWKLVQAQLGALGRDPDPQRVRTRLLAAVRGPAAGTGRGRGPLLLRPGHARPQREVLAAEVRRRMTRELLRDAAVRTASGVAEGPLRLGLVNGWILQHLLFEEDLRRRAVPWTAFRVLWPLLNQRRRVLPLVQQRGIYCFYARPLVTALAGLAAGRRSLEIAAGDGTLTRLLQERGVCVRATDDYSWDGVVAYSDLVERMDAVTALRTYEPEVVFCSWPPPGNRFERHVFRTRSVGLYVVIAPQQRFAAGDWEAYARQSSFALTEDAPLSRYVLPPELGGRVLIFRRTSSG